MLSNTRSTLAIAFAATILGASPALAAPGGDDLRGEKPRASRAATLSLPATGSDLRGENAVGVTDAATPPADDQRARTPRAGGEARARSWSR